MYFSRCEELRLSQYQRLWCALIFPAGANYIKVWDVLSGGRSLGTFSNHQKTITSLAFDGSYHYVITGSLDR